MNNIQMLEPDHFMHENSSWERLLDFYKQENAYLKTRLAELLDHNSSAAFIELAEHFNTRFIGMDEAILSLQKDIRRQRESIAYTSKDSWADIILVQPVQQKLRSEMEHFEKEISTLKNEFNQKLVSFLPAS
jgi:ppGpp synthetase/RelA/SpoT-type nucleotidyltranferase